MSLEVELLGAAARGEVDVVTKLLDGGVNVEARDQFKKTALICASQNGQKKVVELLLSHGADVEAKDDYDNTALMIAARNGHKEVVEVLIAHEANIHATNNDKWTALMNAAYNGNTQTVDLLIAHGANVNSQDVDGDTALILAAYYGKTDTVKSLVTKGADTNAKDNNGKTALDYARERNHPDIVEVLSSSTKQAKLVPVLPAQWSTNVDEKTDQKVYRNTETKEQLQSPPPAYPLLQDPSYGEAVAFYDEATEEEVTSEGSTIDFGTGVEVKVPEGVVPPNTSVTFKAQPAFASTDVFKLPEDVQAASPTYLLSSSSQTLNGNMTLTMEHFVKVRNEDDVESLVFLIAQSTPSKDSTYHFKQVDSGHPEFKLGERVGTISIEQFGFWKVGKKSGESQISNPGVEVPIPTPPPSLYTVRVYRSHENSRKSVVVVCVSYLHRLYAKFLDYLDKEIIPSHYPELSTNKIDQIIEEPLCFEGDELIIQASQTPGWSFEFDKPSITKRSVDLPEQLQVKPEELHHYPPKIVCRFLPNAKAPKKSACTLTLLGLDEPITASIPLFSPEREVDVGNLKEAVFNLRVSALGLKTTEIATTAKQIASVMDDITTILSTSTSTEDLARLTASTHANVLELVTKIKETAKECTTQPIVVQIQDKLPGVEGISQHFNHIAKHSLHNCKEIAEEEKLLVDLVVSGTELVTMVTEVVMNTERLISIAGLDIDCVNDSTSLDVDDDSADILEQLSGLEFEYRALGIHLHLPPGKVNEIQENNPHNASAALGQIITQWLMMNYEYNKFGKPSWRMLTEAISTVDLDHAKLVAGNHKKQCESNLRLNGFYQISDTEVESYPANDGSTTEHINNENETEQRKEMKEVESQVKDEEADVSDDNSDLGTPPDTNEHPNTQTGDSSDKLDMILGICLSLKSEMGTLNAEIGTLKYEMGTLKTEVSSLKTEVKAVVNSEVKALVNSVVKAEVSSLKSEVLTLKAEVSNLRAEISTLRSEMVD